MIRIFTRCQDPEDNGIYIHLEITYSQNEKLRLLRDIQEDFKRNGDLDMPEIPNIFLPPHEMLMHPDTFLAFYNHPKTDWEQESSAQELYKILTEAKTHE